MTITAQPRPVLREHHCNGQVVGIYSLLDGSLEPPTSSSDDGLNPLADDPDRQVHPPVTAPFFLQSPCGDEIANLAICA